MNQVIEFFRKLFDSADWPPRWHCGRWTEFHGWLYIISDLLIWSAYFTIPVVIIRYISKKQGIRFTRLYFLFAAFILACGATHFLDAVAFWIPAYRLNALVRLITGALSWVTVFYLVKLLPAAFSLRTQNELEAEIEQRKKAEQQIIASNERFNVIFNISPVAICITSVDDGKFIDFNDAFCELSGYKKEELIGKRSVDLHIIEAEEREKIVQRIQQGSGQMQNIEIKIRKKNGEMIDVFYSIERLEIDSRLCFIAALVNITERKKAEEKFRGLLETAPDATIIANKQGEIVLVNQQTQAMFGYKKGELIGRPVEILVPLDLRHQHTDHRASYYKEPRVRSMGAGLELYAVRKDGSQFPVEISLSPLETTEGMLVSAAIRDITERKKTQDAVHQLNKELESFTYSVSHDLRAPLRIIDGYADILESDHKEKLDEDGKRTIGIIKSNAQRMGQLIDDLLNLSHTGRKELMVHITDMNKLVQPVIDEQLSLSGNKADIKIEKLNPAKCDSGLIRQVWSNLVANAIKYSAKQDKPVINISSAISGSDIVYSVRDNGVGFDMKYAEKLFGVFQRLHKVTEFEGTGVGLALVKRIVSKHGGKVWADAEPGKGATFYFSLPL